MAQIDVCHRTKRLSRTIVDLRYVPLLDVAAKVDERGILGPSLPGVAKLLKTRRIRIDHLDRAQLAAEPGRDAAGLEPRRPENSVCAHILVLRGARGNSS